VYSRKTVTTFDVVLHEKISVRDVEMKADYRTEDRKVSVMCPLFHNSALECHQCADSRKEKPKLLRVFAVGEYRPDGRTHRGMPQVIKKKLAKKRLKKLYWEELWKAPGVAHARRRKASKPSKPRAYRMLDKKQKDGLFNAVASHSMRTHMQHKQKKRKKRKRRRR
jgi:hypothetical protein